MLLVADISGIQSYLLAVPAEGGRQARQYRARSFRIQLILQCAVQRVCQTLGLTPEDIIQNAAGSFAVRIANRDRATAALEALRVSFDDWLLDHTGGLLRLFLHLIDTDDLANAFAQLSRMKLMPHRPAGSAWKTDLLCLPLPPDLSRLREDDVALGTDLVRATWLSISDTGTHSQPDTIFGLHWQLSVDPPQPRQLLMCSQLQPNKPIPANISSKCVNLPLAAYVPRARDGAIIEFEQLASLARGDRLLGVLKADADSLGALFRDARTLEARTSLSRRLDHFFAVQTQQLLRDRFPSMYTIFAGGDDMLLVGPWNVALELAGEVAEAFSTAFRKEQLTLSAGVAVVPARLPIRSGVEQAEELLHTAKTGDGTVKPRDCCAALGQQWKWSEHPMLLGEADRLVSWVEQGRFSRAWLQLWKREVNGLRSPPTATDHAGLLALSRLSHHTTRNIGSSARPQRGQDPDIVAWAEQQIADLDQPLSKQPPRSRLLPAILTYALFATRNPTQE